MTRGRVLILLLIWQFYTFSAQAELVAWWPFDDGQGTIARDSSKNSLYGTLSATSDAPTLPQWTPDRNSNSSKALLFGTPFASAHNYVSVPHNAKLDLANNWTITAWIKITDHTNGAWGAVFFTDNYCLQVGTTGSGNNQMDWWPTDAGWQFYLGAGTEPALNQWHHVAVTYDGTTFRYYKDGVSSFTKTGLPAMPTNVWDYLYIGYYPYSSRFFVGSMDDVAIWNETLTGTQIHSIYTGGIKVYHATSPQPLDMLANVNTSQVLSWTAGTNATAHNVYFGTDRAAVAAATNPNVLPGRGQQTGTTYNPGTLSELTTYYWRIDEISPGRTETGVIWSFTTVSVMASSPSPANGASDVSFDTSLTWQSGNGATSHRVYFSTDSQAVTNGTVPYVTTASPVYTPASPLTFGATYYWRVDEVNGGGVAAGHVWSFTTASALASSPSPANGAADVSIDTTLTWQSGNGATSHRVYFSTDSQAVTNGTVPYVTTASAIYTPASSLMLGATYYWRVDEINGGGTAVGPVWSFTAGYKMIEPFGYATDAALRAAWVGSPITTLNSNSSSGSGWMMMAYYGAAQTYTRTFSQDLDLSAGTRLFMKYYHGPSNLFDPPIVRLKLLNVSSQILYQADLTDARVGLNGTWQIDLRTASALNTVRKIVLEVPAYSDTGYFYVDDIMLGATMCGVRSVGDLNNDCVVDFEDMAKMSFGWLNSGF